MPLGAITIVRAGLVQVDAVGVVEALFGVGRDARRTAAAGVARMIIRTDRCRGVGIADDGAAFVGATGFAGQTLGGIKFFAAAADIGFVKEAFERALGRAEEFAATRLAAGLAVAAAFCGAIRTKDNRVLIAFFWRRSGVQSGSSVKCSSIGLASVYSGIGRRNVEHNAGIGRRRFRNAGADQRE